LLKHAFEGKLTEQWRKENADKLETAEQLLERIKHEREVRYQHRFEEWKAAVEQWEKDGKVGKKPEKPKPQKTPEKLAQAKILELPTLPNKWKWVKLDELSLKITDGEHFKPIVTKSGVYFLSAKDVRDEGVNFDNPIYVSEETAIKARKRCDPERGDILIVSRGATVGRMCQVDTDKVFCLLGSVILIKAFPLLDTRYLMYALKHPNINREIISISGATAQQAVYLRDVKHVVLPLGSIDEQVEITNKLDEQISNIQGMESDIEDNIARSEALRQSILKKAFSGQLVPQDPNEEPASVLLERIAREKADAATPKKSRAAKTAQNVNL
jgi:type I restriction enzyme S subunit